MHERDARAAATGPGAGDARDRDDAPEPGTGLRVALPVFAGPLDLLLHLIERDELDITTVSLLQVTEQYLRQLRASEQINMAALADFIAVGARLLLLKSRALLPRDEAPPLDEDGGDDARRLVDALREYRRFKEAAEYLRGRDGGHVSYQRQATPPRVTLPTGLDRVTLDSFTELIRDVLSRLPSQEDFPEVQREPVRLRDRISRLVEALEASGRTSFRRLIESATSRTVVIVDFLAVLELIKSRYLEAGQSEAFGDIDLVRREGAVAPDAELLAEDAIAEGDRDA